MTTLRVISYLHSVWPWPLLLGALVGAVVLFWPRLNDDPHGDPATFCPDTPSTWDCLPAGYVWTVPASNCPCGGAALHLLSADGTDLTAAILERRSGGVR